MHKTLATILGLTIVVALALVISLDPVSASNKKAKAKPSGMTHAEAVKICKGRNLLYYARADGALTAEGPQADGYCCLVEIVLKAVKAPGQYPGAFL